jgi:cysteinyl-tRNA synthetase
MASILKIDTILNLFCHDPEAYLARHRARAAQRLDISTEWVETRISQRIAARTGRDWALADTIRKELHDSKVVLMDHPGGTDWSILEAQDSSETTHS